jgi:hypothetical protein
MRSQDDLWLTKCFPLLTVNLLMMNYRKLISLFTLILFLFPAYGQEHEQQKEHQEEHQQEHSITKHHAQEEHKHRLTLLMAYSFTSNSPASHDNSLLIIPTFGINYDHWLNNKWAIGLHNDILLQNFEIEHDEVILERNIPVAMAAVLLYRPSHQFIFLAGYGREWETHKSLQIAKVGMELGIPMPKNWEAGFTLEYDFKLDGYNTLVWGVGFSKSF